MKLIQIEDVLEAEIAYAPAGWKEISIHSVFASDLMSDVLMSDREDMLIITSLSTEQSIRSAGIVDSVVVVVANGKRVSPGMVALAEELGIALLCTPFPKFESCLKVGQLMERV